MHYLLRNPNLEEYFSLRKQILPLNDEKNVMFSPNQEFQILLNHKDKFTDTEFPPIQSSLVPVNKHDPVVLKTPSNFVKDYNSYIFKRPDEVYGQDNFCLFADDIGTQDIIQGTLASCYLIVTLANMSRIPSRIQELFESKAVNDKGIYAMKVYIQGEPKVVVIDDYFPFKDNIGFTFSVSSNKQKDIWVQICEKVWGKVNQSCYLRTYLGVPQEAMYFLNPAPSIYLNHKSYTYKKDELFQFMIQAFERNWIVSTNTEEIDEKCEAKNLIKFHAYAVLDVLEVHKVKLVKLRNPWGNKSWTGKYGNLSDCPEKVLKGIKEKVLNKGSFFMEFDDYFANFPWSFYSKIENSWHYRFIRYEINVDKENSSVLNRTLMDDSVNSMIKKGNERRSKIIFSKADLTSKDEVLINLKELNSLKLKPEILTNGDSKIFDIVNKNMAFAMFRVEKECKATITLHQPQKRFIKNVQDSQEVPFALIYLFLLQKNKEGQEYYVLVDSNFVNYEKILIDIELKVRGEYHIISHSHFENFDLSFNLVISTYAEIPLELYYLDRQSLVNNWLQDLILAHSSRAQQNYFSKEEPSSYFIAALNGLTRKIGYGLFHYVNQSEFDLHIKITVTKMVDCHFLNIRKKEYSTMQESIYCLIIKKKSSKSVLIQQSKASDRLKLNYAQDFAFRMPHAEVVSKYLNTKRAKIYESKDALSLSNPSIILISYESGFVLYCKNTNNFKTSISITIHNLPQLLKVAYDSGASSSQNTIYLNNAEDDDIKEIEGDHYSNAEHSKSPKICTPRPNTYTTRIALMPGAEGHLHLVSDAQLKESEKLTFDYLVCLASDN